ncbi:uncharacterized protein LOC127751267 [Frankliniella occidentalis]|uniref:Uncharacterized protein LOC127751267 n=1 Tax=Frankliniella occidentalis TaxID=133901 RepID=A0A9C6XTJ4_FRAOC|nr:uncharacterized protein LOC127751267 [Frankliniella occidentalis]
MVRSVSVLVLAVLAVSAAALSVAPESRTPSPPVADPIVKTIVKDPRLCTPNPMACWTYCSKIGKPGGLCNIDSCICHD